MEVKVPLNVVYKFEMAELISEVTLGWYNATLSINMYEAELVLQIDTITELPKIIKLNSRVGEK